MTVARVRAVLAGQVAVAPAQAAELGVVQKALRPGVSPVHELFLAQAEARAVHEAVLVFDRVLAFGRLGHARPLHSLLVPPQVPPYPPLLPAGQLVLPVVVLRGWFVAF